jgi:prenyltransferase beta subunit
VVAYLAANAGDYVHGNPSFGEKAGANYAGPTAKLLLVALAAGEDPESFGGIDLVSELRALMLTKGAKAGRFADDSKFGDFSNPLGQAFGVLALERSTSAGAPRQAVAYLSAAQCPDGGFPDAFGAKKCTSSPDATGLVVQALIAADADCSAARAVRWLMSNQSRNGAYTANAVDPSKPAVANVNSTAYATLGLAAARRSTSKPVGYLLSVQNRNGGLPTVPSASRASNLFATAQALPALARTSFLSLGDRPLAARTPTCPAAAPTSTPVPSSSTTTAPSAPTTTAPVGSAGGTGTTTGTTSSTGASTGPDATTSTSSGAVTAVAAGGDSLPRTGTDLLTPVAVGLLLVVVGMFC